MRWRRRGPDEVGRGCSGAKGMRGCGGIALKTIKGIALKKAVKGMSFFFNLFLSWVLLLFYPLILTEFDKKDYSRPNLITE